jgi:alpha-galactosidase
MRKIVFVGGGSVKFVRELLVDIFSYGELQDSLISLMDINEGRLALSKRLLDKMIADRRLPAKAEATTCQRTALAGADFVIISIMVGGYDYYRADVEIPKKYGILQTVSDTTGPGGIMRILRTAPVLKQLAGDVQELCPNAWILNYANPMTMNTKVLHLCGHSRSVGLCHSIQGSMGWYLGGWLGLNPNEIDYFAAGINHRNFYLKLEHKGRDLYPDLKAAEERIVKKYPAERPRFELMHYLGYFPAEGPMHQPEYYPWFLKNKAVAAHYAADVGGGYRNDFKHFNNRSAEIKRQIAGSLPIVYDRSCEFGARIIQAIETGKELCIYGNVPNDSLIANLPEDAVVEVPCLVDKNGITPCRVGDIPPQLAAVMAPHVFLDGMAVKAVLSKDRTLLRQALQADPLTGAILTLPEIEQMFNELLAANCDYLNDWA